VLNVAKVFRTEMLFVEIVEVYQVELVTIHGNLFHDNLAQARKRIARILQKVPKRTESSLRWQIKRKKIKKSKTRTQKVNRKRSKQTIRVYSFSQKPKLD
jgi:hypothetical protein